MDFNLTETQTQFRVEVREFLEIELAKGVYPTGNNCFVHQFSKDFSKQIAKKWWIGLAWPKEYGGKGLGYLPPASFRKLPSSWGRALA
ncbi:MAG: acyl-CoA/acyl-ACP dehydrogenase, partial [Deltaproteobacteria bacterium]|nr:acyl-CoA/acyl-ACP dehydrogenase [Deltaproteobacteria bacterium]